jgi:hypothetical protein
VMIFPGPCTARGSRHRSNVSSRPRPRPVTRSVRVSSRPPVGDDSGAVSRHHDLAAASSKMHPESAFRTGTDRTLTKPYSSRSKALFVFQSIKPGHCQAKARG